MVMKPRPQRFNTPHWRAAELVRLWAPHPLGALYLRRFYDDRIIHFIEIRYGAGGGRLRRDSPSAAPGSSPPAGIPSASSAPRCSRAAPPPTHGSQQRQGGDLLMISFSHGRERNKQAVATTQAKASIPNVKMEELSF